MIHARGMLHVSGEQFGRRAGGKNGRFSEICTYLQTIERACFTNRTKPESSRYVPKRDRYAAGIWSTLLDSPNWWQPRAPMHSCGDMAIKQNTIGTCIKYKCMGMHGKQWTTGGAPFKVEEQLTKHSNNCIINETITFLNLKVYYFFDSFTMLFIGWSMYIHLTVQASLNLWICPRIHQDCSDTVFSFVAQYELKELL